MIIMKELIVLRMIIKETKSDFAKFNYLRGEEGINKVNVK